MYSDRKLEAPWYRISINDKPIPEEYKRCISEVSVDEADNQATMGRIVIEDANRVFLKDKRIVKDTPINIEMGHLGGKTRLMLKGKISLVEADFRPDGMPIITLVILDKSKDMNKTKKSRTWKNKRKSDVVSQVVRAYGLKPRIKSKGLELENISQNDETDIQFIQRLAQEEDYACYIIPEKNEFYWGEKELDKKPKKTYMYAKGTKDIISFRPSYIEKYRNTQVSVKQDIDTRKKSNKSGKGKSKNKGATTNHSPIPQSDESHSGGSEKEKGVYIHYDSKGNTKVQSVERVKR